MTASLKTLRRDALAILNRALVAVAGESSITTSLRFENGVLTVASLDFPVTGKIQLLAVGKAAVSMARAADRLVPIASGLIVTNQKRVESLGTRVRFITASHPLPNEKSLEAGRDVLALADSLRPQDLLLVMVSGGTSALLEDSPVPLGDLQACHRALLRSGMDIRSQNEVRKGLSNLKGGRLAECVSARGAQLVSLIISDIVGDPIEDIGSGPTAPHSSRGFRARSILQDAGLWETMPTTVRRNLDRLREEGREWRDTSGRVHAFVVANNEQACRAAIAEAEARRYRARLLTTSLQGEAREAAPWFVRQTSEWVTDGSKQATIAGGETTVTVRGEGRGGRNQEFALAAVDLLHGRSAVLVACGTDGLDGDTNAAGAIVDGMTQARAREFGLDPRQFLEDNDSYAFFQELGDHIRTGPTGTNVSDLVILLEDRSGRRH